MNKSTMTVLADDTVKGHRVVTYHSVYSDRIMSRTPYRTEIVEPGHMLPTYGKNHASEEEAIKVHREKLAELRGR